MRKIINNWVKEHYIHIAFYNVFLMSLIMLRSAGYFHPYFPISVNFIVVISLVSFVVLFKTTSKTMYIISLIFWLFAGLIKLFHVNIWAERTAIYSYQAIVIATVLLIFESVNRFKKTE